MQTQQSSDIIMFHGANDGFNAWIAKSRGAYFINTKRKPTASNMMLHKTPCPHFTDDNPKLDWTTNTKVCSRDRRAL